MLHKILILGLLFLSSNLFSEETILLGANDETGEAWQPAFNSTKDVLVKFSNPYYSNSGLVLDSFAVFTKDNVAFEWAIVDTLDANKDMSSNPSYPYYNNQGKLIYENLPLTAPHMFGLVTPNKANSYNYYKLNDIQKQSLINKPYFYLLLTSPNFQGSCPNFRLDIDLLNGNNSYIYYHSQGNQWCTIADEGDYNGNVLIKLFGRKNQTSIFEDKYNLDITEQIIVYPLPTNGSYTVPVSVDNTCDVRISIFDIRGNLIDSRSQNQISAGRHTFTFNTNTYATGTYLITLKKNDKISTGRILIVK